MTIRDVPVLAKQFYLHLPLAYGCLCILAQLETHGVHFRVEEVERLLK